jgi:hypothetical protein
LNSGKESEVGSLVSSFLSEKNYFRENFERNDCENFWVDGFGSFSSGNKISENKKGGFGGSQCLKGERESLFGLRINNICRKDWKAFAGGRNFGDEQLAGNSPAMGNQGLTAKG